MSNKYHRKNVVQVVIAFRYRRPRRLGSWIKSEPECCWGLVSELELEPWLERELKLELKRRGCVGWNRAGVVLPGGGWWY